MLRKIINNEKLVIEEVNIGKISKTQVAICYMKNIANDDLVAEVKYRINNLDVDSVLSTVRSGKSGKVPNHLKTNSKDYKYPHSYKNSWVDQQYLPDKIKDMKFYHPKNHSILLVQI